MKENIQSIIETIRNAFQTRDFWPMVESFTDDGVYETPYAFENARSEGIQAIRQRFAQVSESQWNKAVKIEKVTVKATTALSGESIFVEFFIKGRRTNDNEPFDFPSSVALIQIQGNKITRYQDYPNVAGIRKAAGVS
jgi:ketosteroid isomerase-like protein